MADLTIEQIADGAPVEFTYRGKTYLVKQPTTEQYDDAGAIQEAHMARWRALPIISEMANQPCSEVERASYQAVLDDLRRKAAAETDEAKKALYTPRINAFVREIDNRTGAEEQASNRALLARDRYLTRILLCNQDGSLVFPDEAAWEAPGTLSLKNAARSSIWTAVRAVEAAPFD